MIALFPAAGCSSSSLQSLNDRAPQKIGGLIGGSGGHALKFQPDPVEASPYLAANARIDMAHTLRAPKCRISQTVFTTEHRQELRHGDGSTEIFPAAAVDRIRFNGSGEYHSVPWLDVLPPMQSPACRGQHRPEYDPFPMQRTPRSKFRTELPHAYPEIPGFQLVLRTRRG